MFGPNNRLINTCALTLVYLFAFSLFLITSIGRPSQFIYLFKIKTNEAQFQFGPWGFCKSVFYQRINLQF